jgi:predicted Fe-Mo cluster-binding NifX family protein
MIAIPIDNASLDAKSSKLFGNVNYFALWDTKEKKFTFITNKEAGNGIKTAQLLSKWDVTQVIYSFMGDGPFSSLIKDKIDVYYIGSEPMALAEIIKGLEKGSFIHVTQENASSYLDGGTASGDCSCGCSHD